MNSEKKKDSSKWIILILLLITIVAVSLTVWALFLQKPQQILSPDYAPIETEKYAESIPNDKGEQVKSEKGGGSVRLTYSNQVSIDLNKKKASLMFANPGASNQDMVVQVLIQDTVIVQSGTLKPGHQVTTLELLEGADEKLTVGGYDGKFVISYYNQENGEKAIVNRLNAWKSAGLISDFEATDWSMSVTEMSNNFNNSEEYGATEYGINAYNRYLNQYLAFEAQMPA